MRRTIPRHTLGSRFATPALAIAVIAIGAGPATSFGRPTLTIIPLADGNTSNEGRAITWDGKWVVGNMGAGAMTYTAGTNAGYLYNVLSNTVICPIIDSTPSSSAGTMRGVGYRIENATNEIVITGGNIGDHANWMTPDGGATWGSKRRDTFGTTPTPCGQNALGAAGASDIFYSAWIDVQDASHAWHCYVCQYSGPWGFGPTGTSPAGVPILPKDITQGLTAGMNGISASGRVVGWRQLTTTGTYRNNWILDWDPVQPKSYTFGGLVSDTPDTEGEAWSVSADGTVIFGISPILAGDAVKYGYRATFSGTTETGIARLPEFPDTGGSNTRCWPFGCTPDGKFAVGMNYRGMEKAVAYDTSDADTNKWRVLDLTEFAKALGILGDFTGNLRRAYSVGTNATGLVITGRGVDGTLNNRAFVMTVPLPLAPVLSIANPGGGFTLNYVGLGNATNILEYTTNLNLPHTWTALDTNTTGSIATFTDSSPPDPQRFYRVRVQ